jgi:SAM-dependent methyltransferase
MQNIARWVPTKFVQTNRGLRGSRNPKYVGVGSRYIADILAQYYERVIKAHARGRLLDMGCGHVPLYETYRHLVQENVCIDWKNTIHANPFLDESVDLNGKLPFDDQSFDTILLTDVLEHIAEPKLLMREITRLLRYDGKLIMGVPFIYWLHEAPHDYYRYTEHALRRFCDLNGLKVLELEPYGGLSEIFVDLTLKCIAHLPKPLAACLRIAYSPVAALTNTAACRRLSKLTQTDFPLGYVMVAQRTAPNV